MKEINLRGQRFGRLTALRPLDERKDGRVIYACLCICGTFIDVRSDCLKSLHTKSCGCLAREQASKTGKKYKKNLWHFQEGGNHPGYKHGEGKTRLYHTWRGMKQRCYDPKAPYYKRYGKRGIQICAEWRDDYLTFKNWALNNGYAENLTIDRIDNDGNYEPSNCQFLTKLENSKKGSKNLKKKRERLLTMIFVTLIRKKWGGYNSYDLRCLTR